MKDIEMIIKDLDEEILRTKLWINENRYHHGTSVYPIVARYRRELKELRKTIQDDLHLDGIKNYSECELVSQ
jgi:hypothetical protein